MGRESRGVKTLLLPLAWLFIAGGLLWAQADLVNFVQDGRASWGALSGELQAAHPSLPIGSRPTIRNVETGREVVVTVAGRIPVSTERVIDISADAARAIGLAPYGSVMVYFPTDMVAVMQDGYPRQPLPGLNITIHNYVIPRSALPEWLERRGGPPPGTLQTGDALMPPQPRVTPGMPDPNSGGTYRLRVGSWHDTEDAISAFRRLRGAGFDAIQERSGDSYRVYAAGIVSFEAASAVRRLGDIGFMDIHVE